MEPRFAVSLLVVDEEGAGRIRQSMLVTDFTSAGAMSLDLGLLTEVSFLGMVCNHNTCFCRPLLFGSEYLEGGISTGECWRGRSH